MLYLFFVVILMIMFYLLKLKFYNKENNISNYSVEYVSSKLEKEWLAFLEKNSKSYYSKYTDICRKFKSRLENLQQVIEHCKSEKRSCESDDLSFFIYRNNKGTTIKEYIEPLFGILRNTFSVCHSGVKGNIFSKDFLLPSYLLSLKKPIVYIDAGASTFNEGGGGASQNYFYDFYKKYKNIEYKAWYLWESVIQNMTKVEEEVPLDLRKIYHYYNRPIETKKKSNDNPLYFIKRNQKTNYVIFKLDVDNPSVELPIFNHLIMYNDIIPNEFYFEYHFNEPFMLSWWNNFVDKNCSLFCATNKFLALRRKGIRAHGWV